jgi:hypothetical protein
MFGMSRESEVATAPSYGAGGSSPTFMPQPIAESEIPTERSDWIGGDEGDTTRMYYGGPRITGQARPRF